MTRAAEGVDGVEAVTPAVASGEQGTLIQATLEPNPYSTEAFDLIDRSATRSAMPARAPLVGGASAVEFDVREASAFDSAVIPPIVLVVVFLILVLLLRAVVAPLILIGTVILSFLASLGVGYFVFDVVFGFPGSDPSLPLFAFVFLVALGVDYNIFLVARAREETLKHGTREGMTRALAVTGGVITSAGIVLAGTFLVLGSLPLVFLTEIGFVVAFGVLLDTFLVRSVLVPALVLQLGDKVWWPSALAKGKPAEPQAQPARVTGPPAGEALAHVRRGRPSTGSRPASSGTPSGSPAGQHQVGAKLRSHHPGQLAGVVAGQRHLAHRGQVEVGRQQQVRERVRVPGRQRVQQRQHAHRALLVGVLAGQRGQPQQAQRRAALPDGIGWSSRSLRRATSCSWSVEVSKKPPRSSSAKRSIIVSASVPGLA